MPHAQPGMPARFDISRRAAKSKYEKISQALLGGFQIMRGIHRAQDVILRDLPIKGRDETLEPLIADRSMNLAIVH